MVAAAGLGSGLTLAFGGTNGSGGSLATSRGPNSPPIQGVNAGELNVSAIAAAVEPGVVDITSVLGYQDSESAGTGMVLTSNGEVVTNNHVIAGATSISVSIAGSSRTYKAKVLGTDLTQDVALIQMEGASGLKTVTLGNSSAVKLGAGVVAIGNALDLPGPPTVTRGSITAVNRTVTAGDQSTGTSEKLTGLFQTDAPLQPGNSGGPLVNSKAQVIGMNTAAATATAQVQSSNVGFSLPMNRVESIVQQIESGQGTSNVQIGNGTRGYLGVSVESVSALAPSTGNSGGPFGYGGYGGGGGYTPPVSAGAVVVGVDPGSPGYSVGLQSGDVIVSVNGTQVTTAKGLTKLFGSTKPGNQITVGWVDVTGQSHSATVTLATGPAV
ncbi:MAG: S1C family serine protease [Acidimicrobiales bacterium]